MIYAFDEFEVDDARFELRRRGVVVPMQRRAFDLLLHLVRRAGVVCTREELRLSVWEGAAITKDAMAHAALTVRAALGRSYVKTVRGRGYMFVADVEDRASTTICSACGRHRPPPLNRGGIGDAGGDWRPQPNVF